MKGEESEEPAREILQGFKGRSEGRLQKKFEVLKSRFSVWKGKLKMVLKAKKEAAPQDPSFGKTFASLGSVVLWKIEAFTKALADTSSTSRIRYVQSMTQLSAIISTGQAMTAMLKDASRRWTVWSFIAAQELYEIPCY